MNNTEYQTGQINEQENLTGQMDVGVVYGGSTDVQVNGTSITSGGRANIITKGEYNASSNKIATESDLPDISTKQDTLVSGTNIKTINNESILGSGNITIEGGGDVEDVNYDDESVVDGNKVAQLYSEIYVGDTAPTKQQKIWFDTTEDDIALKDLDDDSTHRLVTDTEKTTWSGKQDALVSGTNIKTINNESLLGSGNITTPSGTITSVKMNGSTISSSGEADLGTVITSHQNIKTINSTSLVGTGDVTVQPTLVSGTNIKTINNQSLLGSGNISISGGGGSVDDVNYDDVSVVDNNGVAQLYSEVFVGSLAPNKNQVLWIDTSADDVALRELQDDATHRLVTDNQMATWSGKQDALVSGTNIKTINSQSLLGSGDITISGGSSTDVQVNGVSIVSNDVANLITATAYDSTTNKLATESDLFSGDYDDLTDKPKINNIPISGNKTPQMYGIQPAGNYALNPTVTSNQINPTQTFTLNNNTEYRNTIDMTSLTLNLPSTIDNDYCSWLVFPSGSTATSMTYPNTILWSGDDVSNNAFVPVSDKTYNVCFWYDGLNVNAVVRGV